MPTLKTYEDLRSYLRGFVNFHGDPQPYDFNGIVHLMLALMDNLRSNALDAELEDLRESLTDEQASFLLKIAEQIRERDHLA